MAEPVKDEEVRLLVQYAMAELVKYKEALAAASFTKAVVDVAASSDANRKCSCIILDATIEKVWIYLSRLKSVM